MKRNPVRFRRGLSLNEFLKRCGGEGKCCDAPFKLRWPNGFARPNRGRDKSRRLNARKLRRRCRCKHRASVIAGTIFAMRLYRQPGICAARPGA